MKWKLLCIKKELPRATLAGLRLPGSPPGVAQLEFGEGSTSRRLSRAVARAPPALQVVLLSMLQQREKRQAEAARIRDKYPDRIPVRPGHWTLPPALLVMHVYCPTLYVPWMLLFQGCCCQALRACRHTGHRLLMPPQSWASGA